ncbi:14095_t:CDS:2 [Funneliformis geosporum]|nr:14095_t:CDS:2 [Funneliformis geosporum]
MFNKKVHFLRHFQPSELSELNLLSGFKRGTDNDDNDVIRKINVDDAICGHF